MTESLKLELPEYDQEAFNHRYDELGQYKVTLAEDPNSLGFTGLNKLSAQLQKMLDRVNEMAIQAEKWHAASKAVAEATKCNFETKRDLLLVKYSADKDMFDSFRQLEAKVGAELKDERQLMNRAKVAQGLFSAYKKSVDSRYKNLETSRKSLEQQTNNFKRQNPPPSYS